MHGCKTEMTRQTLCFTWVEPAPVIRNTQHDRITSVDKARFDSRRVTVLHRVCDRFTGNAKQLLPCVWWHRVRVSFNAEGKLGCSSGRKLSS